jgi:hypothetical protein
MLTSISGRLSLLPKYQGCRVWNEAKCALNYIAFLSELFEYVLVDSRLLNLRVGLEFNYFWCVSATVNHYLIFGEPRLIKLHNYDRWPTCLRHHRLRSQCHQARP